jgi:hypothetical protein
MGIQLDKKNNFVGSEVLTVVAMKNSIFWDIMLCSLVKVRGTYHLHLQG